MKLFFQHGYTHTVKLKIKDFYEFDLTEEQIKEAKKRNYKNQYYYQYGLGVIGLYSENGQLRLTYYHSGDTFDVLIKTHRLKESGKNYAKCSCGSNFIEKDKETAMKKFNKHVETVKKILGGQHE